MKSNWVEMIVGAVVLVTAAFFLTILLRGNGGSSSAGYPLMASFQSAEGVSIGGDVRMSGVNIGNVLDIDLNPETFQADVTVRINEGINIPTDSEIKISSDGLLGGSFVEIVAGADENIMAANEHFIYATGSISLLNVLSQFATGASE